MDMDHIEEKFSRIFKYMGIPKEQFRLDASFVQDFEFNEFQFDCLVLYIKNYFELNITKSDYTKLNTIGSTLNFIRSMKGIPITV
jgi:hypothetical protein